MLLHTTYCAHRKGKMINREEFCYPSEFYWINKDLVNKMFVISKIKTIISLVCYFGLATLCMIGYYILYPIRYLHNKCENWCYH